MNTATTAKKRNPLVKQALQDRVHDLLVQAKNPTSKETSEKVVSAVLDEIVRGLESQGEVKLQCFGRFYVRTRPARKNFNPNTGQLEELPATQVAAFAPGQRMKNAAKRSRA